MKIPLEFRRLQAADLSHWRGEPAGLEEFFQSIDLKIHGVGEAGRDVKPAVPPSVQPRPLIQPGRWARTAWPAVAVIVALAGATSALTLWRSQQSDKPGPTVAEKDMSLTNPAPAARDPSGVDRLPPVSGRPPGQDPGKVVDQSVPSQPPAARNLDLVKRPPLAGRAPVEVQPVMPPEAPTTPARATNLPVAAELPKQFEDIVLIVTKEGETEEEDAILNFGDASLVVKDEDSNVLLTLPYSNIQRATYSETQRRIMFVRTTRHLLTLGMGREQVVLQLPADIYMSILSQFEKHSGVRIVR